MRHICTGTKVLNQNPLQPMSGLIVRCYLDGMSYDVEWSNGETHHEQPEDLTLTAKVVIDKTHDR